MAHGAIPVGIETTDSFDQIDFVVWASRRVAITRNVLQKVAHIQGQVKKAQFKTCEWLTEIMAYYHEKPGRMPTSSDVHHAKPLYGLSFYISLAVKATMSSGELARLQSNGMPHIFAIFQTAKALFLHVSNLISYRSTSNRVNGIWLYSTDDRRCTW